jgi:hypothetical protein
VEWFLWVNDCARELHGLHCRLFPGFILSCSVEGEWGGCTAKI